MRSSGSNCPEWLELPRTDDNTRALRILYTQIVERAPGFIVNLSHPRDWHRVTFKHIVPVDYYAGHYRELNFRKPCLQTNVQVSKTDPSGKQIVAFKGAHYAAVRRELLELFSWAETRIGEIEEGWKDMDAYGRIESVATLTAVLVGRFNNIHPFINGNGRMGRLLWTWALSRYGFPISISIESRPPIPYEFLMSQASKGDYGPLTAFIIAAIAA